MLDVISLGAGLQSTTLYLMATHGEITPLPKCAFFADTQQEELETYKHLVWLQSQSPIPVHIVTNGDLGTDWLSKEGRVASPPFFSETDGKPGQLWRQCTSEYKINAINKRLSEWLDDGEQITLWMGISTDEASRMKPNPRKNIENRWPLIEKGMSRWDCMQWLTRHGYKIPPKSACHFCPYHDNEYWRDMKMNRPHQWEKTVEFDRQLREKPRSNITSKLYLHRSLKPLSEVDFRNIEDMGQMSMFNQECEGMCGV